MELGDLMELAAKQRASDIFLKAGVPPALRVHGRIAPTDYPALEGEEVRQLAYGIMTPQQIARFEQRHEADLAFTREGLARFRANVYQQRGNLGMVLRLIPLELPSLDELGMPPVLKELPKQRQGLILVTGPTGSGKSTTLAAMINQINATRKSNIITVEDPIEFVHPDKMGIVSQREVGIDTEFVHGGAEVCGAPEPGRDPDRRDARRGDDERGDAGVGDGAPGLLHGSHSQRG